MMGLAQFFWWVIPPSQDRLCMGSKESLFGVYFESGLVLVIEYGFGTHGVQSWLGLIKMLGLDQICLGLVF